MLRFLPLSQVETFPVTLTQRHSLRNSLLILLGLFGATLGLVWIGWRGGIITQDINFPSVVAYYLAVVLVGYGGIVALELWGRLGCQNWLLKIGPQGLLVKIRSYLNAHLPELDPVVIWIPFRDLAGYQVVSSPASAPAAEHLALHHLQSQHYPTLNLYLSLDETEAQALVDGVAAEVYRQPPRQKTWYGHSQIYHRHYPVKLMAPNHLQIDWDQSATAHQIVKLLGEYCPRLPTVPPLPKIE